MNKRLSFFLFAIGIGAASAPVYATNCSFDCIKIYHACLKAGDIDGTCEEDKEACFLRCGF